MKCLMKQRAVSRFLTLLALLTTCFTGIANVGAADHGGQLVGEVPRRDLPVVLDGDVRAHAQIGNRIFVGGNFQRVQRPDGTTITQPNIFAYNINTGLLDESFRPAVNDGVLALAVNPRGDALYVGGRFTRWDNSSAQRIVKLNANGSRDTRFRASASAIVRGLAATNNDVYLAGDFYWVSGDVRVGFAAVDANTGAVDPGFIMDVEDSAAEGQLARGIVVTSDGKSVFGLHFGTSINGARREVLVKINTAGTTARLANWRVDWSGQTRFSQCRAALRDIAIAPDDSFIVVGGQGSDNPPNCDSVLRYPTRSTGVVGFDWSARFYSSVFSLAVSDTAVYVGGHFCAAPLNGAAAPSFQTHERTNGTANKCKLNDPNDPVNPSVIFPNHAVFRFQLAALDPSDGRALAWDPGTNAGIASYDLTVIDRGLLAGMDNDRYGGVLTGRSGFFDFSGFTPPAPNPPDPTPPAPEGASCTVSVNANDVPVVSYSGFTNVSVVHILRNSLWVENDSPGTGTYNDTSAAPGVAYSYVIRSRPGGVVNDVACSPATITIGAAKPEPPAPQPPVAPGGSSCTVALNANDVPVVSYSGFPDTSRVNILRNGRWLVTDRFDTPGAGTYNDTSARPGVAYSYVVRSRRGGVVNDVACSPATITIGAETPPQTPVPGETSCSVSVTANNSLVVSYSGFVNESSVNILRNGRWLVTDRFDTPGAGSHIDGSAVRGVAYSYVIRSRPGGGVVNDVACSPDPFTF